MSRAFQSVRDLLGHIGFIVRGEYRVRLEGAAWIERAFRHDALPLAEQIRQHALIIDQDAVLAIGHFETHRQIIAAHHTTVLDQSAEPDARSRRHVPFDDIAGRIEKNDRIAKRIEHQRNRDGQHSHPTADQNQTSLLASHRGPDFYPSSPRPLTRSSMRLIWSGWSDSARRASAAALLALSRSPRIAYARTSRIQPSTSLPSACSLSAKRCTMSRIISVRWVSGIFSAAAISVALGPLEAGVPLVP